MNTLLQYEVVKKFLKTYSTDQPPYDFNGLLHLVLAGVDNLRVHAIDQDFADYAWAVSEDQAAFLRRLLDSRAESIGQFEDEP
jgi:hypothetical protein